MKTVTNLNCVYKHDAMHGMELIFAIQPIPKPITITLIFAVQVVTHVIAEKCLLNGPSGRHCNGICLVIHFSFSTNSFFKCSVFAIHETAEGGFLHQRRKIACYNKFPASKLLANETSAEQLIVPSVNSIQTEQFGKFVNDNRLFPTHTFVGRRCRKAS